MTFKTFNSSHAKLISESNSICPFLLLKESSVDEPSITEFNLQSFEAKALHEDPVDEKQNILILSDNGLALIMFSWNNFKDYTLILDVSVL
jgi:hypothetical protein